MFALVKSAHRPRRHRHRRDLRDASGSTVSVGRRIRRRARAWIPTRAPKFGGSLYPRSMRTAYRTNTYNTPMKITNGAQLGRNPVTWSMRVFDSKRSGKFGSPQRGVSARHNEPTSRTSAAATTAAAIQPPMPVALRANTRPTTTTASRMVRFMGPCGVAVKFDFSVPRGESPPGAEPRQGQRPFQL